MEQKFKTWTLKQSQELGIGCMAQLLDDTSQIRAAGDLDDRVMLIFNVGAQDVTLTSGEQKTLHDVLHDFIRSPYPHNVSQADGHGYYFSAMLVKEETETRTTSTNESGGRSIHEHTHETWHLDISKGNEGCISLDRKELGRLYSMLRHIHMDQPVVMGSVRY